MNPTSARHEPLKLSHFGDGRPGWGQGIPSQATLCVAPEAPWRLGKVWVGREEEERTRQGIECLG